MRNDTAALSGASATSRTLYKPLPLVAHHTARCVVAASAAPSERAVWCATNGSGLYKVLLVADAPESAAVSFLITRIDSEQGMPSQNAFAVTRVHNASGDEALSIGT